MAAIFGSPGKEGRSSTLHDAFLRPFQKQCTVIKMYVYEMDIQPCTGCGFCADRVDCIFKDDMIAAYTTLLNADLITVSSPLYFSSLTGSLKCFIDRCQVFWELRKRSLEKQERKYGFFISVGGGDYPRMFEPSTVIIRHFFNTLGCIFNEKEYQLYEKLDTGDVVSHDMIDRAESMGQRYLHYIAGGEK